MEKHIKPFVIIGEEITLKIKAFSGSEPQSEWLGGVIKWLFQPLMSATGCKPFFGF